MPAGNRLSGRVAIVTGAGTSGPGVGSGRAIALAFAREGASVLIVDRVKAHAEETLSAIRDAGGQGEIVLADITLASECEAAINAAIQHYGQLHVLVNNVGVTRHGDAEHVTEEDWDFMFDVNLKSMMLMSRYAIPYLSRSGAGSIINISSTGAVRPPGGHIAYDTSKGGVVSLTISLAVEQGRNGIRANCIMPGRMITPMVEEVRRSTGISPEQWDAAMRLNLLGRLGSAWDIAAAAVFLASDDAAWITSVVLPVDGGFLHTPPGFRPAEPLPAPASEVVDRYQDSAEPGRVPQ